MTPLDVREWLEAERLAGNPFAGELLELVACEPEANENADAIGDLVKLAPEPIQSAVDRWRLVEWITDRLRLLDDVETLLQDHASDVMAPNGMPHKDAADWLEAVFQSPRWQQFDL